jgi:DNA-binding Xre family transcriptional regulator
MNERYKLNSEKIRSALAKDGRKQSWLANQLGISGSLLDLMLGEAHVPKAKTMDRLAEIMGCTVEELLIPKVKQTA